MPRSSLPALRAAVDALLVGQETAKTGCLLALVARQHVYLEGPPGCGKSALARGLATASGARFAALDFHRETRGADLLGPTRLVRRPTSAGERLRVSHARGPLQSAELLLLDDLQRAPGEALLPLLRALSERRLAGEALPLECAIATGSPPAPGSVADPLEATALDRFAVQLSLHGLGAGERWRDARRVLDAAPEAPNAAAIETAARHRLQARAAAIPIPAPVREALLALVRRLTALRAPDGAVFVSDRSLAASAPPLLRAHALLRGATGVALSDLSALRFMLGRRVPATLLALAEELVEAVARGEASFAAPAPVARARPGEGEAGQADVARRDATTPAAVLSAACAAPAGAPQAADVARLLRVLAGRLEPGRVDRGPDPGGSPRRQARLERLDELDDADAIEALLFVDGALPGTPRVLRRERRRAAGALAVLRDVSASMEGRLGRAASQVVAGLVRLGARRRMRIGYLEFHHEAERFEAGGAFFHRRYGRLLALAARERAEGRTSYEAPLRAALAAFGPRCGGGRHAVLLTDGRPIVGDPWVVRERALARRLGVRVHTVYMGSGEPPQVLERLARETGGRGFVLDPGGPGALQVCERSVA